MSNLLKKIFSKLGKAIYLYDTTFQRDEKIEVDVDTRTRMIYTKLSGNYPQDTEGIFGSPHQLGLVTRNGDYMSDSNVNNSAETWQVRDTDPHIFNLSHAPQYLSKYWYDVKKLVVNHRTCHLKEVRTVRTEEATSVCATHHPSSLQNFFIDIVLMTGDLDSDKDEFYEQRNTHLCGVCVH